MKDNKVNDEKTVVYSSLSKSGQENECSEKTIVSENIVNENAVNETVGDNENNNRVTNKSNPTKKRKEFSAGAFAAGVGGAVVVGAGAGIATGAVYSDEIKEVYAELLSPEDASAIEDVQEIDPSNVTESPDTVEQLDPASFSFSANDGAGNTYSISFIDNDGDGLFETTTANAQLVDGTTVSYTETGDPLSGLFGETTEWASPQDYQQLSFLANSVNLPELTTPESFVYEIQPGDTLSEIAASNNTTVEHLMELNPDITDADVIYASDQINIPLHDNISNPYESHADEINLAEIQNLSESVGEIYAENLLENEFAPIDWQSFNDEPVGYDSSEYDNLLAQTDFNNFELPDSYLDNFTF